MQPVKFSINVITTTIGRDTLPRLIESFINFLDESDYYTIISDTNHTQVEEVLSRYKFKCTLIHIKDLETENKHSNKFGHHLINKYKSEFKGDFILFADDDDRYATDGIISVKNTIKSPDTMYIFKHKWNGIPHWTQPVVHNIGKCMVAIPNLKDKLPYIQEDVMGDFYWFPDIVKLVNVEFIDKIIYLVRNDQE